MAMSEAHKEAIRRGVKKYHSECRKAMNKPSKKPAPPVKTKPKKERPQLSSSKKPEIFFDTIPSPPPKKKLTEAEILKLEARDKPKAKPVKKVKKVRKKK